MNRVSKTNQRSRRSIQHQSRPISIDSQKTNSTPLTERQISQPIPIKVAVYTNESDCDSVDSAHYDMLTWRMYNRIVNARRMRAISRSNENCDEQDYFTKVDYYKFNTARMHINRDKVHNANDLGHEASILGRNADEELPDDDQVFVLELVD
ncbi:hypothetical protein HJC23_007814 [Cyclotella cryptica]|uniref:Uncharacterized protein n=1 Tax=Cyclotella cryptica TaxID=29204 RepID=A0ABD3R083_9STRA|eukprot:CCRYP_000095-RA/>CCRYP_000095-RA protein AED:0.43 eAED:0.43 QI:0/-1/0/1/-1/1/1/0/151